MVGHRGLRKYNGRRGSPNFTETDTNRGRWGHLPGTAGIVIRSRETG